MKLWICIQLRENNKWDFQGVFFREKRAVAECRNENYFIAPFTFNKSLPDERLGEWPGLYFPKRKEGVF